MSEGRRMWGGLGGGGYELVAEAASALGKCYCVFI